MRRYIPIAMLALMVSPAIAQVPAPTPPASPFEFAGVEGAWQAAQESREPVLLFVTSDHCYYCKKMVAETLSHPRLAPAFARLFETAAVNADRNPELVDKLGVRAYPTTVVISPEGQLLGKLEGFVGPEEIGKKLNPVLRAYREQAKAPAGAVANR